MPRYDYDCPEGGGHTFEQVAGIDDDRVVCLIDSRYGHTVWAVRRAVYRDQAVIFSGPDFTKSVIPPPAPAPTSTAELTTDERMEVLDDFAKENHDHDENIRPYAKEAKAKEGRKAKRHKGGNQ